MSDSMLPKSNRIEYWTKVFMLLGAIGGGCYTAWLKLGDVATDTELEQHDTNQYAHKKIRDQLDESLERYKNLTEQMKALNEVNVALGEYHVSVRAADEEPKASLKAAAATFRRNEYKKLIRRGYSVKQAMDEAMEVPWSNRPRF